MLQTKLTFEQSKLCAAHKAEYLRNYNSDFNERCLIRFSVKFHIKQIYFK